MRDFMTYLVENIENCISEDVSDIKKVRKGLVFGSNTFEVTLATIKKLQDENAEIYVVLQAQMVEKIKEYIDSNINIIAWSGSYDVSIVDYLRDNVNDTFDAIFFYTQQANDLGNMNLLKIARYLNDDAMVFGMDKSLMLVQYKNFSYYYDALMLYGEVNKFVRRTEELVEK